MRTYGRYSQLSRWSVTRKSAGFGALILGLDDDSVDDVSGGIFSVEDDQSGDDSRHRVDRESIHPVFAREDAVLYLAVLSGVLVRRFRLKMNDIF